MNRKIGLERLVFLCYNVSMMNKYTSCVVLGLLLSATANGETGFIDFREEKTPPGWDFGATEWNRERGRLFVNDGDAIVSPTTDLAATSATVVISFTQSNSPRPSFQILAGPDAAHLHEVANLTNRVINIFTTNVLSFTVEDDIHLLKIVSQRNGNLKTYPYVVGAGFGLLPSEPPVAIEPPPPAVAATALKISDLGEGLWTESFDACAELFPPSGNTVAWVNGETLGPWQAFQDDIAPSTLNRNNGATATGGLYAYWATNGLASTYALGMNVASTSRVAVCGVAFTNDTTRRFSQFELAYTGRQFGFKNKAAQDVLVEWLVTNALVGVDAEGAWTVVDGLTFTTPAVGRGEELASGKDLPIEKRQAGALDGLRLRPGEVLLLRWRRDRVTNSAALGIDDVAFSWQRALDPTLFLLR